MSKISIIVDNKSIELVVSDRSKKLEFPSDVLKNQEILNSEKYMGLATNFFNENNLHEEKVIILLSKEILYEKDISFKTTDEEEKEITSFLSTIPFDNKKIALLKIPENETEKLIGVNKELYSNLLEVCELTKLKVEAVLPLKVLGDFGHGAVNWKVIPPLVEKADLSSPYNFLASTSAPGSPTSNKKLFLAVGIILLLIVMIAGAEFYLRYKAQRSSDANLLKVTTESLPSSSEVSPTPTTISKEKLTIEVLNGSGVAGQASEIRNQLLKLGYTIVETGNYEGTSSAQTTVSFSDKVSSDIQDEITKLLKTDFSDVVTIKYAPANFEIVITTGTATK